MTFVYTASVIDRMKAKAIIETILYIYCSLQPSSPQHEKVCCYL